MIDSGASLTLGGPVVCGSPPPRSLSFSPPTNQAMSAPADSDLLAAYLTNHFWSWQPCWKQVTCRTVCCETCHKERIARWVDVCYGDEAQNVRSTYCSFECADADEHARKMHCFLHRAVKASDSP